MDRHEQISLLQTDRQTDRQTDGHDHRKKRPAVLAVSVLEAVLSTWLIQLMLLFSATKQQQNQRHNNVRLTHHFIPLPYLLTASQLDCPSLPWEQNRTYNGMYSRWYSCYLHLAWKSKLWISFFSSCSLSTWIWSCTLYKYTNKALTRNVAIAIAVWWLYVSHVTSH